MKKGPLRLLAASTFLLSFLFPASAAELSVPELQLISYGSSESGLFVLKSKLFLDMALSGGDKFGANLKFDLDSGYLENDFLLFGSPVPGFSTVPTQAELNELGGIVEANLSLNLKTVSVSIRTLFGAPLDFCFFAGSMDTFCSGEDFSALFGTAPIASEMRGYLYFPEGLAGDLDLVYDGIHGVKGTGAKLSYTDGTRTAAALYLYQDMYLGPGRYSADARYMLNADPIKLDCFMGASYPASQYGLYRCGLMAYAPIRGVSGIYAQIGIPYFDPADAYDFGIDNFFFLFEPRVSGKGISFTPTFFYHPGYYLQKATGESGVLDINLNLKFGDVASGKAEGGAECLVSVNATAESDPWSVSLAPFVRFKASGAVWDAKLRVRLYPFETTDLLSQFQAFFGVRTGF